MHDTAAIEEARIARFIRRLPRYEYRARSPLMVSMWDVPEEPVPFAEVINRPFRPIKFPQPWGPAWATTWFHAMGQVPTEWRTRGKLPEGTSLEVIIDLGFTQNRPGFQCEGLVFSSDGTILSSVAPRRPHIEIDDATVNVDLYIEAAANPDVASEFDFDAEPLHPVGRDDFGERLYTARAIDFALRDIAVWELLQDMRALDGLMRQLPAHAPRRHQLRAALMQACDAFDTQNPAATAADARAALQPALSAPAAASAHRIYATGNAHIDSAWLWPIRETIRKCARTFSGALALMDEHPEYVFAVSSAQQLQWMKDFYPQIFEGIRARAHEGRFIPVGGMWIEPDMNLPSGESIVRQFLEGKRFFLDEFGIETREAWVPDTFGYSAALPQLIRAAGNDWFLTQKISWNQTNRFPHSTFSWEGIDGSTILTHFPPAETYFGELIAEDLARAERNHGEHSIASMSLIPFGFGDGGGGPTREMLAAAARTADLEGSPRVQIASPQTFFEDLETELSDAPPLPVWTGELYLELHRGTYTTQQPIKRGNRRSESLLRAAELWATTAAVYEGYTYPYEQLQSVWRRVLLNQFHDILPGSSITWVHREAAEAYEQIVSELEQLIDDAVLAVVGEGEEPLVVNATPFTRFGVAPMAIASYADKPVRTSFAAQVSLTESDDGWILENQHVTVEIDGRGLIVSLVDRATGREAIAPGGVAGLLQLHRDLPNEWNAWDLEFFYRSSGVDIDSVAEIGASITVDQQRASVTVHRSFGASQVTQQLHLLGDSEGVELLTRVDWHERDHILKLSYDLDVLAETSEAETQFGHVKRPTHTNTSWDQARFEISAHRWIRVGEPGYGVSIANHTTYGHDVTRVHAGVDATFTRVRQSLLRGPGWPDPTSDIGEHYFRSFLRPNASVADAVRDGYSVNDESRAVTGAHAVQPLVTSSNPMVVVDAVKLAEDRSGDVIVRLYEAEGARQSAEISFGFEVAEVVETDLLERRVDRAVVTDASGNAVSVTLRPFKLATLRVTPAAAAR